MGQKKDSQRATQNCAIAHVVCGMLAVRFSSRVAVKFSSFFVVLFFSSVFLFVCPVLGGVTVYEFGLALAAR